LINYYMALLDYRFFYPPVLSTLNEGVKYLL
jgi:hypothetical protein